MKIGILTILLLSFPIILFSQKNQDTIDDISNSSDLIIEGLVKSSYSFISESDQRIYTEYEVEVSKIFKGADKGFISIIKRGGGVDGQYMFETDSDIIFDGLEGVFFLKETSEGNYALTKLKGSYARYYHDGVNHKVNFLGKAIRSYSQLYEDIFKATGIHYYKKKKSNIHEESINSLKYNTDNKKSLMNNAIIYSFENINFSSSTQNLSFDVYESHNNNEILGDLEVYFKYNTDVFGEYLYTNSKISIAKGAAIQSSQYAFEIEDVASDIIRAKISGPCSNSANQEIVNNGFSVLKEELLKVEIIQSGFYLDSLITFDYTKMKEKSTFYDPTTLSCVLFDDVFVENPTVPSQVGSTGIEYGFRNIEITGQSPEFFEFDIAVKADSPGTLFATSLLEFFYNEDAFGSYIFDNNKITVTELNGIDQWFLPIFVDDNTAFSIAIQIGENDPSLLFELTEEFTPILHIKIEILDCTKSSLLSFNETLMQGQSEYIEANNTSNVFSYNPVIADDTYDNVLCESISILDFFPRRIPAGDGDKSLLTIKGNGFGPSIGKVFFVNGDNPSTMIETNQEDISLWSENEIQLTVPSMNGASGFCGPNAPSAEPAASGEFRVVTANSAQSPLSFAEIEIPYAAINYRFSDCTTYRPSLVNKNGSNASVKGYTFNLGPNLSANSDVVLTLEKALCEWNRGTGISWDYGGASTANSESGTDNINLIFEDPSLIGTNTLMRTYITGTHLESCVIINDDNPLYVKDIDIGVNPNIMFQYDHSLTPSPTEYNFFRILKHELGHAHSLAHALYEEDAIMFRSSMPGDTHQDVQPNDLEGGTSNLVFSNLTIPLCINGSEITIEILTTAPCAALNVKDLKTTEVIISPNPTAGSLDILFESPTESNYNLFLYSTTGKVVFQTEINIYNRHTINLPSFLNSGVYFLNLKGKNINYSKAIIFVNEN